MPEGLKNTIQMAAILVSVSEDDFRRLCFLSCTLFVDRGRVRREGFTEL
jgi:hypothetical protein